jgi:hypothetical protein
MIDYTSFSGTGTERGPISYDRQWWKLKQEEIPAAINGVTLFLNTHQSRRLTQNLLSTRLYGNLSIMGLNGITYSKVASVQNALKDRISYNVVQSVVDTLTSKIAKNKPKPLFLTSGGDYKLQRKAKKLDKFCEGIFYENEYYKIATQVFRDACIWDAGVIHVYNAQGRVKMERVIPLELYVDEVEAFYGNPRQLHWVKNVDRAMLLDMFPGKKKAIMEADEVSPDAIGGYENISDVVTVRQSWHLPSGPGAKDGKMVISTTKDVLEISDWERDCFPFAFLHYNKRLFGFWGQGLAEQLQNIQLEINKLLWVIQRSMHLAGSFKVLLENSSKIVKEHLNNDIGAIVNYTGTPPQYITPPIVQPEVYQHLMTLKEMAYEQAGISQLSAASKKPQGLDSGKALREYNDIETDRFMTTGQDFERLALDTARLCVAEAKTVYEDEGEYEVKVPGKKFIDTIDWGDVDLPDDSYTLQLYPVSSLSKDPAGRLQEVQEYVQAGFITPRAARRLLDFPDLEQEGNLSTAQENYVHEILEKMINGVILENGEVVISEKDNSSAYTAPEPQDNLDLCSELALEYYSQGKCNGLEEEKLDLLRQFMDQVDLLSAGAQAAAQQQMMQAQMAAQPPAPPVPMNPSPLVSQEPMVA